MTIQSPATRFDDLFAEAAPLIRAQRHRRETPPEPGGRWPVSVVLSTGDRRQALEDTTNEAAPLAGIGHWHTGRREAAHVTVRALEYYRHHVDPAEPAIQRYRRALDATAEACMRVRFQIVGLTLAPGALLACLAPLDDAADRLRERLAAELGADAWLEDDLGLNRDIWHLTLLHFAADVAEPERLVAWVDECRRLDLGTLTPSTLDLVRFRYDDADGKPFMRPELLAQARL